MPLSEANVIQSKMGSAAVVSPVTVSLDAPTQGGGTLILEIWGMNSWSGMPDGWEFDGQVQSVLFWFRYPAVPGGLTSWQFSNINDVASNWLWRLTEWDTMLDPVSPLDAPPALNALSGAAQSSWATGTTQLNSRDETVALAIILWLKSTIGGDPSHLVTFSDWTDGFTERGEIRATLVDTDFSVAFAWRFNTAPGTFSTTATITDSNPSSNNGYYGSMIVYAASTAFELSATGATMVGGG